jgi:LruC domain-containing protein
MLMNSCQSFINGNVPDAAKVQILSGNPYEDTGVEVLAEAYTTSAISKQMTYIVPSILRTVYAVVRDADDNILRITSAPTNSSNISFGTGEPTGTPYTISPQRFFYCYEADYPNPGDWDYNDIVFSVTKELTDDENVVALNVTLNAVGYLTQIAAALRLVGYPYDDVEITQDEKTTFVTAPDHGRTLIKQKDLKLKALNGDAVINLFDDAHLAMFHLSADGSVYRRYFNTMENGSSSTSAATQSPVTVTYYIEFANEYEARNFNLGQIDPFIVVQYGQTGDHFWEIHTYPYKLTEMLFNYYEGAAASYNNGFSWAIAIPYKDFRWPLEGEPIGMRKNSIVSGAYQESGHSFGEWTLDHADAQDWYEYPAEGGVY